MLSKIVTSRSVNVKTRMLEMVRQLPKNRAHGICWNKKVCTLKYSAAYITTLAYCLVLDVDIHGYLGKAHLEDLVLLDRVCWYSRSG